MKNGVARRLNKIIRTKMRLEGETKMDAKKDFELIWIQVACCKLFAYSWQVV